MTRLSLDDVRDLAQRILRQHGFAEPYVVAIAESMVAGERDECKSHGIYRLLGCIGTLKAGKVIPDAVPEVVDHAPSIVRVDAKGGFAQVPFLAGLPVLVDKARQQGMAMLAINNCVHFSALWSEMEALAAAGLVALACTPNHAWVAPAGGSKPVFGTNPIAFCWPRAGKLPFIFDFATSAVARGEIELHRRGDKSIPEGWGIDADGHPTTDAQEALDGAMLTFGGYKGSALAAMVELLAGPLIGDMTSQESLSFDAGTKSAPYGGELIIAIDPQRMLGEAADEHLARAETMFDTIQGQGARLPSQRRYEARERTLRDGVDIPDALYADLMALLEHAV